MLPHRQGLIGLAHRGFRLRPSVPLLPRMLAETGYSTHLFGTQHETHWQRSQELGYRYEHLGGNRSCEELTPAVIEFLASGPAQPFFAYIAQFETHRPYPQLPPARERVAVPPYLPDAEEVQQDVAELNAPVRLVDASIGQVVSALKQHGLWDNTVFL